jgi:F0F1-type ATP synthase membrane subunit b/b'
MQGETRVSDEAVAKVGTLLEQLGVRFELVLEAVTGFGGRLDSLREEMVGQFAEVGRQIRFLSDRIAENRDAIATTRADLGAEMVRLGEMLGATRVEFREQIASARHEIEQGIDTATARSRDRAVEEVARVGDELRAQVARDIGEAGEALRREMAVAREDIGRELPAAAAEVREQVSSSSDAVIKRLDTELKQTNKTLTSLARKFDRFDDRITVQTKDQDQRLRKLEQRRVSR